MIDTNESLAALLAVRSAFGNSSEAVDLVKITDKHLRYGRVAWLEVGAGDGRNLQFQLERLSTGRRFAVTAIEPAAVEPALAGIEWITSRSENYRTNRRFDWISVRHSAYYLVDPIAEIARLVRLLTDGGVLALTHWARQCILHRLHVGLCGDRGDVACSGIEEIAEVISHHGIEQSRLSLHDADFDVSRVLADSSLAHGLYVLACRGRPAIPAATADPRAAVARILEHVQDPRTRRNGILLLRAPPP